MKLPRDEYVYNVINMMFIMNCNCVKMSRPAPNPTPVFGATAENSENVDVGPKMNIKRESRALTSSASARSCTGLG